MSIAIPVLHYKKEGGKVVNVASVSTLLFLKTRTWVTEVPRIKQRTLRRCLCC